MTQDKGAVGINRISTDQTTALTLLRTGQMPERRYFELCRENGWPEERLPGAPRPSRWRRRAILAACVIFAIEFGAMVFHDRVRLLVANARAGCFPWAPAEVEYHPGMTLCPGQSARAYVLVPFPWDHRAPALPSLPEQLPPGHRI